jgi:regulator of protease activity HflC (stomatin/prohibitin superfamily)
MILFTLGVVAILVSYFFSTNEATQAYKYRSTLRNIGFGLLIVGFFTATVKQIEPGEVGVKSLFGNVQPDVLESGLHMVNPLAKITTYDTQTQNYTMSAVHNEGERLGDDAIRVLSKDGLELTIDLTVLFKIDPLKAPYIYKNLGINYTDKIIRPLSRTLIRDNAVYYEAVKLYAEQRAQFQDKITKDLERYLGKRGLILEQILIRNISLPESVKRTIESKINAEQEAQKMQFVLSKEKQEAERKRLEAQGIADYQRIVSSTLSDKQLQYEQILAQKELAKSNNTKVLIMGNAKTPLILSDK